MSRNKLYLLLSMACLAGYAWLIITFQFNVSSRLNEIDVCIFKNLTGIPCPSCGSTHSVLCLLQGEIYTAFLWNPFGFIIISILITVPIWIIHDILKRKSSLYRFYNLFELKLKEKWIAIPLILIVLGNWIWNIYKGL